MAKIKNQQDWKINHLEIKNFKSIKHINIDPARVNIFIGVPNAGKSNILEALTFMSHPFTPNATIPDFLIRYKSIGSLFYDYNNKEKIEFLKNKRDYTIIYDHGSYEYYTHTFDQDSTTRMTFTHQQPIATISEDGLIIGAHYSEPNNIFKYHFKNIPDQEITFGDDRLRFDGSNIWRIIRHSKELKSFASAFLKKFNLSILYQKNSNKFDIMKLDGDSYSTIDFVMTPDTFQRMLYYLAAIDSNKNSVLLFEEPEAHSYPPYIQQLAESILDDKHNQYFITTHSPSYV
jgi:AAA15 family ATPase/GTPase